MCSSATSFFTQHCVTKSVYIITCSHPIFFSDVSYTFVELLLNSLINCLLHGHLDPYFPLYSPYKQ